jgi:hypothetical protein
MRMSSLSVKGIKRGKRRRKATLKGDAAKIKEKIAETKEKNVAKVQELFKMHNNYPAEVSALICCFQIVNTDFFFLQAAYEIKKQVEVKIGPFATFNDTY